MFRIIESSDEELESEKNLFNSSSYSTLGKAFVSGEGSNNIITNQHSKSVDSNYNPFGNGSVTIHQSIDQLSFNPFKLSHTSVPCDESSQDSTSEDPEKCKHRQRDEVGTCIKCGHWTSITYTAKTSTFGSKGTTKSILPELKNYPISDDIKIKANIIYNKIIAAGAKKMSKSQLICFCLFQAGKQLNSFLTLQDISAMTGKNINDVARAIKYYGSPSNCGYKGVDSYTNPFEFIECHGKKHGLTPASIEVIKVDYITLTQKDRTLREKPIGTVVAALIYCYKEQNGLPINTELFEEEFNLTIGTIDDMEKKMVNIQNS